MSISRRSQKPAGITNAAGEPEIVLEVDGLTISLAPPPAAGDHPLPAATGEAGPASPASPPAER